MKAKLFISLSTVALIGLSATVYGGYTKYVLGDGKVPKGDCLEMMCPNGCVEEEETLTGHCCPGGDACRVDGKDIAECCGEGKTCKNGKCESNCLAGSKVSETKPELCCLSNKFVYDPRGHYVDAIACGCPAGSKVSETKPDVCCLNNYVYDGRRNNSVDAMACGCPGGRQKYTEGEEEKCCPENYQLPKHGESCNTSCGCFNPSSSNLMCSSETNTCGCPESTSWLHPAGICCPNERNLGQHTCCAEGQLATTNGCCASDNFYTDNGIKKCCKGIIKTEDGVERCIILSCQKLGMADGLKIWATWGDKCNRGPSISYTSSNAQAVSLGSSHSSKKSCASKLSGSIVYFSDKSFSNVQVAEHIYNDRGSATLDGKDMFQEQSYTFKAGKKYPISATDGKAHHVGSQIEVDFTKIPPDLMCH